MRVLILILGLTLCGCCAHRRQHVATVPGCDAYVLVPAGCYTQRLPDGIQVRCADGHTTDYRCKNLRGAK